jgi:hypothetical protein
MPSFVMAAPCLDANDTDLESDSYKTQVGIKAQIPVPCGARATFLQAQSSWTTIALTPPIFALAEEPFRKSSLPAGRTRACAKPSSQGAELCAALPTRVLVILASSSASSIDG